MLGEVGQSIDAVINFEVPFDLIRKRLAGRLQHPASGRIYNIHFTPPKEEGKDDVTGEPLIRREDDDPKVVEARLQTYQKQSTPIFHLYKSDDDVNYISIPCETSAEGYKVMGPFLRRLLANIQ